MKKNCEIPPIATVAEIARYLRVRPNHIYAMFKRGEIPGGKRVGRSIRFKSEIVMKWFEDDEPEISGKKRKRGAK